MTTVQDAAAPTRSTELPPPGKGLFRYSVGLVVAIFLLMKVGAMVTSTNSGILEHSHWLLGALVGLYAVGLLVWVARLDRRRHITVMSVSLLLLIIVQGLLGGLRVLENTDGSFLFAVIHGILAQVVLALAAIICFSVSNAWISRSIEKASDVRTLRLASVLALVLVLLQVALGVMFRHTENAYAKWMHVGFALFVALAILVAVSYSMGKFNSVPGFTRINRICLAILAVEIVLGFVALMVRRPKDSAGTESLGRALIQSAHVILGASLLLLATVLVARSYRNLIPRNEG